jgi:hypothetical protein
VGNRSTRRNNLPVAIHWQTLSHHVVLSKPRLIRIWTQISRGHHGRDSMVVRFITTYSIKCLPPLTLWVQILIRRGLLNTTWCDKVCQWIATGRLFLLVLLLRKLKKWRIISNSYLIHFTLFYISLKNPSLFYMYVSYYIIIWLCLPLFPTIWLKYCWKWR